MAPNRLRPKFGNRYVLAADMVLRDDTLVELEHDVFGRIFIQNRRIGL